MPTPVSLTRSSAEAPSRVSTTSARPPHGVNFAALPSRFPTTCAMRVASPTSHIGSKATSHWSSMPAATKLARWSLTVQRTSSPRSSRSRRSRILPRLMRPTSSRSSTRRARWATCVQRHVEPVQATARARSHAHDGGARRGEGAEPDQGTVPIAWGVGVGQVHLLGGRSQGAPGAASGSLARSRGDAVCGVRCGREGSSSCGEGPGGGGASPRRESSSGDVSGLGSHSCGSVDSDRRVAGALPNQTAILVVLRSWDRDAVIL